MDGEQEGAVSRPRPPVALTIAGSDSGGGAGIQADLKTFAALGVHGTSVLAAITAQNTVGVQGIHMVPAEMVARQVDSVLDDIGADAVKTGMLGSADIVSVVAGRLRHHHVGRLVVDPVMVASSGDRLFQEEATEVLVRELFPLATVVTPNMPEAEVLAGFPVTDLTGMERAARAIADLGAKTVVVKGGHLSGKAVDVFFDGRQCHRLARERINVPQAHGTGCTFASAIAAGLARGMDLEQALETAKEFVTCALRSAYRLGSGPGTGDPTAWVRS
jgi:hydroxymethylpyrimidine/phosphomethylpyrimidine kinase